MGSIRQSTEHIYYEYYRELLDIYYGENHLQKNEKIDCVLRTGVLRKDYRRLYQDRILLTLHDIDPLSWPSEPHSFNLYLMETNKKQGIIQHRLQIKFTSSSMNWDFVGLPMN